MRKTILSLFGLMISSSVFASVEFNYQCNYVTKYGYGTQNIRTQSFTLKTTRPDAVSAGTEFSAEISKFGGSVVSESTSERDPNSYNFARFFGFNEFLSFNLIDAYPDGAITIDRLMFYGARFPYSTDKFDGYVTITDKTGNFFMFGCNINP